MDFTSLKYFPVRAMLRYSLEDAEVGGLHPLYGDINFLEGKSVVYCETERSRERCKEIVDVFERNKINVIKMNPSEHDLIVNGINQNSRIMLFETFGLLAHRYGFSMRELYNLSPPPTKALIDLLSRQVDSSNDSLYSMMLSYNDRTHEIKSGLIEGLDLPRVNEEGESIPKRIRKSFGEDGFLKECQERAKKIIELS
jgi:prephenate dehydrogenase